LANSLYVGLAVVWLLLLAAVGIAIWYDIIRPVPLGQEQVAQFPESNRKIDELCAQLVGEVKPGDDRQTIISDCKAKVTSSIALTERSFDEWNGRNLRKRLWLILFSLLIAIPAFWFVGGKFRESAEGQQRFWLLTCFALVLLLVLVVVSIAVWNQPDYYIAYVPVPILEWGFAGGMLAVIHRLAYGRYTSVSKLYLRAIATPVIGLFMSGVVYFIALGGAILIKVPLNAQGQLNNNLWLNAIAFIAAFNEKFAEAVVGRFTLKLAPAEEPRGNRKDDVD